ncbi:MAG: hypothetical protein ABIB41_02130 [Nitrospirota bacterium]
MKISNCVIIGSISFILGAAAGWIAQGRFLSILFTSYVPALATLLAAYFGAKYAFDFQRNKEIEDTKRKNIVNGNVVIFNILQMINNLLNYQKQIIDPVRGKSSAFLEMSPTTQLPKEDISVDLNSIYYILETVDRNLLGEISVELSRYQKALDAINERSIIHIHEVQPTLEKAGIVQGGDYRPEQIKAALGNRLYVTMHEATKQVIEHVDNTLLSLQEVGSKLTQSLKKQFPSEAIISISIPEQGE